MRMRELELEARVPLRRPMKRQSLGNRPHSAHLWARSVASVEALEQSSSWAHLNSAHLNLAHLNLAHPEKRTSHANNPGRKFVKEIPTARANRPHWARLLARSRRAALQKTHSRAAQSLPHWGESPPTATHSRPSPRLLLSLETMSASRPRSDHLYSWYWSTFTFSSTPMASSVRTAMEQ